MTDIEFQQWLLAEVDAGRMELVQQVELMRQKQLFEDERNRINQKHAGLVVGYAGDKEFIGLNVHDLFAQVRQDKPGNLVYFEPIGFELF